MGVHSCGCTFMCVYTPSTPLRYPISQRISPPPTHTQQVHIVERIPWHEALWFVTTTLTTVGFGDVVVRSTLGRMVVLALILVGVVLIPVQAGQLYAQLAARRVQLGMTLCEWFVMCVCVFVMCVCVVCLHVHTHPVQVQYRYRTHSISHPQIMPQHTQRHTQQHPVSTSPLPPPLHPPHQHTKVQYLTSAPPWS